jgi:hypothetical protein
MLKKTGLVSAGMLLAASAAFADFSYQTTTRITGGALVSAMKVMGAFSKNARQLTEPMEGTIAVKGDRLVHRMKTHTSIIDLSNETITSIDPEKKTYSVITFAEMKQALDDMARKMKQSQNGQAQAKYKVSAENTGKTRQIAGLDTKEIVMKLEMEVQDTQKGSQGNMTTTVDSWIASGIPGYAEVRDFYRRMGEKLAWAPGGNMFMGRPDVMQGMAEVQKEMAKVEGVPVMQVITMGGTATVPNDAGDQPSQAKQQQQPPPERPSLGGMLGGRFGLGKKKAQQQDTSSDTSASGSGTTTASGALMEMTAENTGFSAAPVDPSLFEIPAGYKKVESDMRRMQ